MTNRQYAEEPVFREACHRAGLPPTKRQACEYRHGRGRAFSHRRSTKWCPCGEEHTACQCGNWRCMPTRCEQAAEAVAHFARILAA